MHDRDPEGQVRLQAAARGRETPEQAGAVLSDRPLRGAPGGAALACLAWLIAASAAAQPAADDPVIARVLGTEVRESQRGELKGIIFGPLIEAYRKSRSIEATRDEIDLFITRSDERDVKRREEWRAKSAEIERRLASEEFDPEERQRLEEHLATLRQLLEPNTEMERWRRENPEQNRAIQEQVARQTILGWKTNKRLFEEHGGRVIFQQAGPEPLDAYRKLLEEQAGGGAFEILDPAAKEEFWRYFVDERMHAFLDMDGAEIFATPWWLLERPLGEPPPED